MKKYTHNFDIDLVYLWADGNDLDWTNKKNTFLAKTKGHSNEAISKARTANNDELLFSLRSVERFAPWIRKIYIVTDEQKPNWLNTENPRVEIVDIRQILPEEALPCYNSVVIEYFLYKISGLSEHFIYANDDMFFNKEVDPSFFFNLETGMPVVRLQRSLLGKWTNKIKDRLNIYRNVYRITIDNAAKLIENRFGHYYSGTPHHNIDAYLKSDYKKVVEKEFKNEIEPLITNHFRSKNDIQRIIFLYYALANGKGKLKYVNRRESCRIRLQKPDYRYFINKYQPTLFCLNDTPRATDEDRLRVNPFLSQLFPYKSTFEL